MQRISLALALLVVACAPGPASTPEAVKPAELRAASVATIAARVEAATHPWLRRPRFASFRDELEGLYVPRGFAPLWLDGGRPNAAAAQAVALLAGAGEHGLDPRDYDVALLDTRQRALAAGAAVSAEQLALFDVALSVGLLRFASDLHIGRANPRSAAFVVDVEARKLEIPELVLAAVRAGRVRELAAALEPPFYGYRRLRAALVRYRALARDPAISPVVVEPPLRPGDATPWAPALASWLAALGDLRSDVTPPAGRYEGALVGAVERFQRRHGLADDGVIDAATARALAAPPSTRLRQMELALERYRWIPEVGEQRFLFVDLPAFTLEAFDARDPDEGPALSTRVVVGRAGRTPTPVLAAPLRHVVLSPYWNVPRSIVANEMLPKLAKDPGYLAAEQMEIVAHGEVIADPAQGIALLASGGASLRQRPGPKNALGRVKFLFPNPHNVYLHGTPARTLFERSRRDFSHGCVRVERAEALAAWALHDQPEWTRQRLAEAMAGPNERWVALRSPILVVLFYTTAQVQSDGTLSFYPDLYGHDAALEEALARYEEGPPA